MRESWLADSRHRLDAVEALRDWAEGQAEDAIAWYLRDKAIKRIGARVLRALAILLVVGGGVVPLLSAAWTGTAAGWGYVLLAAAAGCVAFDHFFGLSSGWMRDIVSVQTLQRRLTDFRMAWTTNLLRPASMPGGNALGSTGLGGAGRGGTGLADSAALDEAELVRRLDLVQSFVTEIADLVESGTAEWLAEFRSNVGGLDGQTGWSPPTAHQPGAHSLRPDPRSAP
jgi:hypothetical protein